MNNQVAIDMLQPGDVLVVDLFGQAEGGTIVGDNLFYYIMKTTKNGGLVVDGAIRDLEGISRMDMPAYFRARPPERDQQRRHQRHQRAGTDRQRDGDAGRSRVRRFRRGLLHPARARRAGRGQGGRDPHPRRVDADEIRRGQVQVERHLRHAERSALKKEYDEYLKKRLDEIRKKNPK